MVFSNSEENYFFLVLLTMLPHEAGLNLRKPCFVLQTSFNQHKLTRGIDFKEL